MSKIQVDWNSFKEVEVVLKSELDRLMKLRGGLKTIKVAINRRKQALQQLYEWMDFLRNHHLYSGERGERMKQLLEMLTSFKGRERVKRLELQLLKITPISHYRYALRLKAKRVPKQDKIIISAELGLNDWGNIGFYMD